MNRRAILWTLISLVLFSCLFDVATFFYFMSNNGSNFESNPIFLFLSSYMNITLSIILILLFKLSVNGLLIWALLTYKPSGTHLGAYFLVFATIIGIIIQFYGGYTNLLVHNLIVNSTPGSVIPLSSSESYSIFATIYIIYGIVVIFEALVFWLYEKIYRI